MVDFNKEIASLRSQVSEKAEEATSLEASADATKAVLRESDVDVTKGEGFDKLDAAYKPADKAKEELAILRDNLSTLYERQYGNESHDEVSTREAAQVSGTVAERFTASDELTSLRSSGVLEGSAAVGSTIPVEVATRDEVMEGLRLRTTVTNASGSGGGVIWSDRREDFIVMDPQRSVRLLDVLSIGSTDTDTVEWVKETTHTDAAANTAYGTSAPESAYGFTKQSTTVKRIPHFVPATKGALADSAQLRTLLDNNLLGGIRRHVEAQAWAGGGTGEDLLGITATSGIGSNAFVFATDTRYDIIHEAITDVRVNLEQDPTAIVIHPADYEKVVLEKDTAGNYVHGRSIARSQPLWGLQPVITTLATEGNPVVGDYTHATLWIRTGLALSASDSHSDYFLKGLVAILAEMRAAFAVTEPKAFSEITNFNAVA